MNIRLLNEELMCKEKSESSQTIETTLLAQKHFESKRSMRENSKDIYVTIVNKQAIGLKIARRKNLMQLHKQKTKEGNVVDSEA